MEYMLFHIIVAMIVIALIVTFMLTRCKHKWEVMESYITPYRGEGFPIEKVYISKCVKCGKIKKFYV